MRSSVQCAWHAAGWLAWWLPLGSSGQHASVKCGTLSCVRRWCGKQKAKLKAIHYTQQHACMCVCLFSVLCVQMCWCLFVEWTCQCLSLCLCASACVCMWLRQWAGKLTHSHTLTPMCVGGYACVCAGMRLATLGVDDDTSESPGEWVNMKTTLWDCLTFNTHTNTPHSHTHTHTHLLPVCVFACAGTCSCCCRFCFCCCCCFPLFLCCLASASILPLLSMFLYLDAATVSSVASVVSCWRRCRRRRRRCHCVGSFCVAAEHYPWYSSVLARK